MKSADDFFLNISLYFLSYCLDDVGVPKKIEEFNVLNNIECSSNFLGLQQQIHSVVVLLLSSCW